MKRLKQIAFWIFAILFSLTCMAIAFPGWGMVLNW